MHSDHPPFTIALASCMRNEGLFILEWLAHHIVLGFQEIIVVTNDCTDGSDNLLDRLQEMGLVTHIRNTVLPDENPQLLGMDLVLQHCRDQTYSHVLHIDSDEFLDIRNPDMSINDIVALSPDADLIPFPWRFFGDSGIFLWTPGELVTEKNYMAEPRLMPGKTKFKCLFRTNSFQRARDHSPFMPLVDDPVLRSVDGKLLHNVVMTYDRTVRFKPKNRATKVKHAWLSHYAVRSVDIFAMKAERGKGSNRRVMGKYNIGSEWYMTCNRNDKPDISMQRYVPGIKHRMAEWRKDPVIQNLEKKCHDWFEHARAEFLKVEEQN